MFKHLTDFSYKRNTKEAIGFYFAYLLLFIIVGGLIGGFVFLITGQKDAAGLIMRVAGFFAVVAALTLSFLILKKKNLLNNLGYIILSLLSGLLAFFGGGLLGLIPIALLTTRGENTAPANQENPVASPAKPETVATTNTNNPTEIPTPGKII